jgi:predicted ABC-type ATPase
MSAPEMLVVAGPAGSGKTTAFPPRGFGTDFFSVDDRCAELNGGLFTGIRPALRAQVALECRRFVERHIADRASFAVETTLRSDAAIRQAEAANAAGFSTFLFFLGTEDVRLNIDRIATRGRMGGHSSPEADIREIFAASMANLPRAVAVFSHVDCFDNSRSGADPVRVLAFDRGRLLYRADPLPAWAAALVSAATPE